VERFKFELGILKERSLTMTLGPLMTDFDGLELDSVDREILSHPLVGGVILFSRNYESPEQIRAVTEELHALRSPKLLIAVDHEGGRVQRFRSGFTELPAAAVIGKVYDDDPAAGLAFAQQCGWLMAAELRSVGVDFSFAPVLDLGNPNSRIIDDRAFHKDPHCVARIAHAYVKGMHNAGMAAVGKHFPGHGTVVADSHVELPVDNRSYYDIANSDLITFRLMANDIEGVMPAHIVYPAVDNEPAGFSAVWVNNVLRQELNFKGIVFSDDLNMAGAAKVGGVEERASVAIDAGCDVILLCNDRSGTERLISNFSAKVEPVTQVRLMRMHGKGKPTQLDNLSDDERWLTACADISRLNQIQALDLGDDMLG
jgi:beta-N-acetylhexosaminidase